MGRTDEKPKIHEGEIPHQLQQQEQFPQGGIQGESEVRNEKARYM